MDDTDRTSASETMNAEEQAIAQDVDKAFKLYESIIQTAKLAANLGKKSHSRPRNYSSGFIFLDD